MRKGRGIHRGDHLHFSPRSAFTKTTHPTAMKPIHQMFGLVLALLLVGCASTNETILDSHNRAPTQSVDVFKDGKTPERAFTPIAELSFLGPPKDELRAQNHFVERARELGGSAVIFSATDTGERSGFPAYQTPVIMYKGTVIIYQ